MILDNGYCFISIFIVSASPFAFFDIALSHRLIFSTKNDIRLLCYATCFLGLVCKDSTAGVFTRYWRLFCQASDEWLRSCSCGVFESG